MSSAAHARDLRKGRVSEIGRAYLVTTVTRGREPVFRDLRLARGAIKALADSDRDGSCATLAFVLMPDHLHWLLRLDAGNLSALVGRYKRRSAAVVNALRGDSGAPLWQQGFHDHAVRGEEDLASVARYVVANPVRAGIVDSVRRYPHWDAVWL